MPEEIDTSGDGILVCTPGTPGEPHRGGVPQMVRLAETLQPYVFVVERVRGLIFVFDHDEAGLKAAEQVVARGFRRGDHVITLDPREHSGACATKQVVIEDLLGLGIQKRFFDQGRAWCSVDYEAGELVRFRCAHESKRDLCDFACANGTVLLPRWRQPRSVCLRCAHRADLSKTQRH